MMRRVLALVAVLAMVIGPPLLLVAWGFTDWGSISIWSATDVRVLLGAMTLVGWAATSRSGRWRAPSPRSSPPRCPGDVSGPPCRGCRCRAPWRPR